MSKKKQIESPVNNLYWKTLTEHELKNHLETQTVDWLIDNVGNGQWEAVHLGTDETLQITAEMLCDWASDKVDAGETIVHVVEPPLPPFKREIPAQQSACREVQEWLIKLTDIAPSDVRITAIANEILAVVEVLEKNANIQASLLLDCVCDNRDDTESPSLLSDSPFETLDPSE